MSEIEKIVTSSVSPEEVKFLLNFIQKIRNITGDESLKDGIVLAGPGTYDLEVRQHLGSETVQISLRLKNEP